MRITRETDYAFRICGYLAQHEGEIIGAPKIAEDRVIPERFTLRILRKLNQAGITTAKRGVNGGYTLKKPKEHINLYDIVVAIDGPIVVNRCLDAQDPYCSYMGSDPKAHLQCRFHSTLGQVQNQIIDVLKGRTLDMIVNPS
ncbi:Rrf2 family transcriptional regulator [Peptoniphilus equinus]|uniref:Rrf2 family transcriptional regulator n=1 Tax=Peptoniphilus equinus TaxID=3016343 RepID=A0ABY7QUL9_9FIRM|nr:Rrf2 family transcriptional regulator [Peptoniphilus equinus]WBW50480.1 Rrf2 family transcriptional regulator [Peptoniphilus equinus]